MTSISGSTEIVQPMPRRVEVGPAGAARPAATGMTAADVWRIIRRRLLLIITLWLLVMAAAVGLTFFLIRYYPVFSAASLVQVESTVPADPLGAEQTQPTQPQMVERLLADQALLVKQTEILRQVVQDAEVRKTQWYNNLRPGPFGPKLSPPELALEELLDELGSSPVRDSSYIRIAMSTHDKESAPIVVNTVVTYYINHVNQLSVTRYRGEVDRLLKEQDRAKRDLDSKVRELEGFREEIGAAAGLDAGPSVHIQQMMNLSALRTEAEIARLGLKAIYEQYSTVDPSQLPVDAQMRAQIEMDPQIAALSNRLLALQEELEVRLTNLQPEHRVVRDLEARIAVVEEDLRRLRESRLNELKRFRVEQTRLQYLSAVDQSARIEEEYLEADAKQRDLDRKRARLLTLLEERDLLRERYEEIADQVENMRMQLRRERAVRIQQVATAVPPRERSSPRWVINLPVGFLLGGVIAVGLAFLLELMDTSVRTPRDVMRFGHLPLLGSIPVLDDEEIRIDNIEMAVRLAPHSLVAESFRQIRTNLQFAAPPEQQRSLMITSPQAADGKTATAINLAVTIAAAGRRVLLVDANLRRPALASAFGLTGTEGFSNLLIGQGELTDYVSKTDLPGLDVLAAGPLPPNPAELLGSNYLRQMIAKATETYDQIIFDAPAALLVTDAMVLATVVDGVVLVVRARANSRGMLTRTAEQLGRVGAHTLGGVLNAVQAARGGYFRKQYRSFYEYQALPAEQTQLQTPPPPTEEP